MFDKKTIKSLLNPFPLTTLRKFDFGSADGARDELVSDTFVLTSSIKEFSENNHSLVIGPIGSGKTTLFRLLKEKSKILQQYEKFTIISIEESISFHTLNELSKEYFSGDSENLIYSTMWKFQIINKLVDELSGYDDFPKSSNEKRLRDFLGVINVGDGRYASYPEKILKLISLLPLQLELTIAGVPAIFEAKSSKSESKDVINLDLLLQDCEKSFIARGSNGVIIAIDKIDKFVAGEDYKTQRIYLGSLLEVEDDLSSRSFIKLKIFIRQDLFERLDFSKLGYDKINDNALRLRWSNDEIISFIAKRAFYALKKAINFKDGNVLLSTNLDDYHLSGIKLLRLVAWLPNFIRNKLIDFDEVDKERHISLKNRLHKAIITKIFPREIIHLNNEGVEESINIFDFLTTHFRDGHNVSTPRYMLIFLKEVHRRMVVYYEDNPDQEVRVIEINGDYEWPLFKKRCVYDAYVAAKEQYAKNIRSVDELWKKQFVTFLSKKGNKTQFDYKWIRSNLSDLDEFGAEGFLAYLQVIGYLKIKEKHPDIRNRVFELPILFREPRLKFKD